ncbi:MAG: hypothetical protein HYV28_04835, partial [Ignavibacteriales bacterium]|nr:hypothetical protein [Ignavibacteriales bacterium]
MRIIILVLIISVISFAQEVPIDSIRTNSNQVDSMKNVQMNEIYIYGSNTSHSTCLCDDSKSTESLMDSQDGISIIKRGNFAHEAVIHGLTGEQITVTIDAMHIFGACTDKMDPVSVYVEKNNLRKIQTFTMASDFSGGQNIGGSINLITQKPEFINSLSGNFLTGFESASNLKKGEGTLNFSRGNYSFRASFSLKNSDNF